MMVVVSYDVCTAEEGGAKRLRQVAKACENFGQRVQFSVFECVVDPAQWVMLKTRLESIINPVTDSLRYYYLGSNWTRRVEHYGAKQTLNIENDSLIV